MAAYGPSLFNLKNPEKKSTPFYVKYVFLSPELTVPSKLPQQYYNILIINLSILSVLFFSPIDECMSLHFSKKRLRISHVTFLFPRILSFRNISFNFFLLYDFKRA